MFEKFTALLRSGRATRILVALCCLFALATVIVGLRHETGYALGFLAAASLYVLLTRRWRSIRAFAILFGVCAAGIVFLSFLYVEVFARLAVLFGGIGVMSSLLMRVPELIITYVIIFGGVTGIFFGLAGTCILGGLRLAGRHGAAPPP